MRDKRFNDLSSAHKPRVNIALACINGECVEVTVAMDKIVYIAKREI